MKKLLILPLLTLLAFAVSAQKDGFSAGDVARDFTLKSTDGEQITLSDYAEEGAILIFSCNSCPWVKLYEDRMIELHNEFASQGYPVIAVNPNDPERSPDDSFAKMQERAIEKGFPFAYVYDESQEIARAYGATRTPEVYLVQKVGDELQVKFVGAIDNNPKEPAEADQKYVAQAIEMLKQNMPVAKTSAKAIGCTIKWKPM